MISKGSTDAENLQQQVNMAQLYVYEANQKIFKAAKDAILSYTDGFEQKLMLRTAYRFSISNRINPQHLRREIANYMIKEGKYPF